MTCIAHGIKSYPKNMNIMVYIYIYTVYIIYSIYCIYSIYIYYIEGSSHQATAAFGSAWKWGIPIFQGLKPVSLDLETEHNGVYTIVKWKTLRNLPDISTKKILENIELFGIFLGVAGNVYINICI